MMNPNNHLFRDYNFKMKKVDEKKKDTENKTICKHLNRAQNSVSVGESELNFLQKHLKPNKCS